MSRHKTGWRLLLILILGVAALSVPDAGAGVEGASTEIVVVTPFTATGAIKPGLHLQPVSARCLPDNEVPTSISKLDTYTCFLPANASAKHPFGPRKSAYVCRATCRTDPCWRIPRVTRLTMACLGSPDLSSSFEGFQGTRVRVINDPAPVAPARRRNDPTGSQPWRFDLQNHESCVALYPDKRHASSRPQILDYICDLGNPDLGPFGKIDRSEPLWTIPAAKTQAEEERHSYPYKASITRAWFIGNGPT